MGAMEPARGYSYRMRSFDGKYFVGCLKTLTTRCYFVCVRDGTLLPFPLRSRLASVVFERIVQVLYGSRVFSYSVVFV